MRLIFCFVFLVCTKIIFGQINLHSYQTAYTFNPAFAGIDSTLRTAISYSYIESYWEYSYADIAASMHIKQSRYGISGYFKMYDYISELAVLKPVLSMISFNSIYKIRTRNSLFYFKPAIEIGFSHLYWIGQIINDNQVTYIVNERDSRFRYSASWVLFNNNFNLGLNYQGINRPDYIAQKPDPQLPPDREIGISFSNLFVFMAMKKDFNNNSIAVFLTSADRFPYIADLFDHYWSIRRIGFSYTKPRFLFSGSFGVLNNNVRFKEYKGDFVYRLWHFDLGLKIIYCDDPRTTSPYIMQGSIQPFPMSNATIINFSLSYYFSKYRSSFSNWANILVF